MPRLLGTFTVTNNTPFTIPCGAREAIGAVILKNLSGFELAITYGGASDIIAAHSYERLDVAALASWDGNINVTPQMLASNANNAPSQLLVATAYAPGEPISAFYPMAIDRLSNVGNTVSTSGSSTLKNDGNQPGTQIIESTPSDQAVSAFNLNNDGSGTWQVLSANVQRIIAQIVRGNNTTGKATIQFGDSGDATLATFYGTFRANNLISGLGANNWVLQYDGTAHVIDLITPQSGAQNGILFAGWSGTAETLPFGIGTVAASLAHGGVSDTGGISKVADQAAVGSLGVPVIVAQTINQAVTSTATATVLSYTPPVQGLYRVGATFSFSNSGASTLTLQLGYGDPNLGIPGPYFMAESTRLNAFSVLAGTATYACQPIVFYAATSHVIAVAFTDSAGVPNDHVSVIVERLS